MTLKNGYTDTDSFIINIKTEDFFQDFSNDVEKWFDTSNYDKNDKSKCKECKEEWKRPLNKTIESLPSIY